MVSARAIAALGRLFRRHPRPSREELAAYASEVVPTLVRAERLYQDWFEQAALFADGEKLANAAAVHRWEAATLGQGLGRVTPPPALARAHAEVIAALQMASRAAQLLSSGSRYHNSNAVCDGQTHLEESRDRRLAAAEVIRRAIERQEAEGRATRDREPVGGLVDGRR
jgi:hypothetical protein